jgi:hypothetical protein
LTASRLELNIQSSLFQDSVSRISGNDTCCNREATLRGWALPNFMASFSLTYKRTAILQQNLPQLRVITAPHRSHSPAVIVSRLHKLEIQAQGIRVYPQLISFNHIWSQLPHALGQSLKGIGFCHQMQRIAFSGVHAVCVRYFNVNRLIVVRLFEGEDIRHSACILPQLTGQRIGISIALFEVSWITPPELFKYHFEGKLMEEIRSAANKGMALGNERFEAEIESLTGRKMTAKKMGRAVG